jgi:leader peptidase (prepilin peptidase)/N-methyltransferase
VNWTRFVLCLVASLPAGWIAGTLYERVPTRRSLLRPFPRPHIGGVYLTLQLFTTALFAIGAARFNEAATITLVSYLVFFTAMVALAAIDLDTLRLPDLIVGGCLVVSIPLLTIAALVENAPEQIQHGLIGGGLYFGFLLLAHLVHPSGMGFGDVKLSAVLGLFVGWVAAETLSVVSLVLYSMLLGFLVGSAVGIVLVAVRRRSRAYPFGPFLIGGAVVIIAFSTQVLPV